MANTVLYHESEVSEQTTSLFPDVDDALIYFHKRVPSRHALLLGKRAIIYQQEQGLAEL